MRVAYAGDWHANTRWAIKAIEYAKEQGADEILHLGDYGYNFTKEFRDGVEAALVKVGLKLSFVDGNHENFEWLLKQPILDDGRRNVSPRVYHLPRGYTWSWEDVQFVAVGGAFSVDRQWRELDVSWWIDEELTDEQIEEACRGDRADIMISHDCPSGVVIPGIDDRDPRIPMMFPEAAIMKSNEHRTKLRKIVDALKPREIWHGHYHRRYEKFADFGYGEVMMHGLDMDATELINNVVIVDVQKGTE